MCCIGIERPGYEPLARALPVCVDLSLLRVGAAPTQYRDAHTVVYEGETSLNVTLHKTFTPSNRIQATWHRPMFSAGSSGEPECERSVVEVICGTV